MKLKQIISILLILTLLSCALIGCGKKKTDGKTPQTNDNIIPPPSQTPNDEQEDDNTDKVPSPPTDNQSNGTQNPGDSSGEKDENGENENTPPVQLAKDTLNFESNGDGTCTLVGIGQYTDACLVIPEKNASGESVTDIAEKAFYSCPTLTAVQIPASVVRIGDLAFGDCANLIYIGVNSSNTSYKDVSGVLYTFDGKELISYPAAKAGSYTTIDDGVRKIHSMAFYACKYLRTVYYAGDCEEWDEITVGSKNYSLTAASIQYSVNGK